MCDWACVREMSRGMDPGPKHGKGLAQGIDAREVCGTGQGHSPMKCHFDTGASRLLCQAEGGVARLRAAGWRSMLIIREIPDTCLSIMWFR